MKKGKRITTDDFLGKRKKIKVPTKEDYERVKKRANALLGKPKTNDEVISKIAQLKKQAL